MARFLTLPVPTVHREVQRLLAAGVLRTRPAGRTKLLTANHENRATRPLTELLTITYGPHLVVAEEFAPVPNADIVLIFGSWAKRYHGQPGPAPHDIEVLVVGEVDRADVHDAADNAQRRLGLPVNPTIASHERWSSATDPLVQEIQASPVVLIRGEIDQEEAR